MRIMREYKELLETNIGQIIEENLANGIKLFHKAASCTENESVTEITQTSSMFSHIQAIYKARNYKKEHSTTNALIKNNLNLRERSWTNFDKSCYSCDKYVLGMKQYCKKMDKMIERNTESSAQVGTNTTNAIYD